MSLLDSMSQDQAACLLSLDYQFDSESRTCLFLISLEKLVLGSLNRRNRFEMPQRHLEPSQSQVEVSVRSDQPFLSFGRANALSRVAGRSFSRL